MSGERRNLNPALWLECAGPLVTLPSIGSHVVYFPQGHSEQVAASTQKEADPQIPGYPNLPSQLICKLHNITLHAEQETDEVYAQMTLQPVTGGLLQNEKDIFATPDSGNQTKRPTIAFSKTLTASDTSTHGGFSIPRRAAEKVFPPLDYTKTPPAQELLARDLHNNEWHFRHIYRGQPRRHLLTTGWSVFVSAKRLQAGDTVLFMRDETGQLLLGIRRANRQQPVTQSSLLSSDSMLIGVLAAAAHAAATSSRFTIFYNPRASPSEFVIPLAKYNKAMFHTQVSVGMRFRMELETEDSSTRRYMGTITGIGDLDPVRWPKSSWRSLKVGWDESTAGQRQRRVSLWEIEPISAPFLVCHPSLLLRPKRARPSQGSNQTDAFGEEEEVEGIVKKTSMWDRGDNNRLDVQNSNPSTFGLEHWMRVEQRPDVSSTTTESDYYRAMAAAALQEFRKTDASKPVMQHPNPPVLQFQQMQFGTQQQQPALVTSVQQQSNVPQLQTQISQLPQQQMLQLPNMQSSSMQFTSNGSQTSLALPASAKATSGLLEANMNMSSLSSGTIPLHNFPSRINSGAFMPSENGQYPSILRSSQSLAPQQTGIFTGTAVGIQDSQVSNVWNSSVRESMPSDSHPILSPQIRGMDVARTQPGAFTLPRTDPPGQVNPGTSPLQSTSILFKDTPQEPEPLSSDARSHLLFGVNIDNPLDISGTTSWSGGNFSKQKELQNGFLSGTLFSSSCSNSGSDMQQMNSGIVANASLDDNGFLQQPANWPQMQPAPVRTFTKVYKLGSVGRSLDITRFRNYDELRRELAQMFSLQGQLEDPLRSGWQVVFVDNENDVLLVGDDPWEEFVNCVRFIKILSPIEVLQMNQERTEFLNAVPSQHQTSSSSGDCAALQDSRNQCSANLSSAFER
ncbi:hypothetical protein O6H91_08G016700 [Diphasiastrum complanatum]|uniref:Uncharacterized protein n=1 Tax=Diphasiastrum complanatum TaxID=34168 RepID=A0ACC2CVC3_DIPCM|nr:hypothetical protein O6H91_08G016700 [Diphasiastrum complanatum]